MPVVGSCGVGGKGKNKKIDIMNNPHFYLGTRKKEDTLYLFHNKALNIYKFGVTAKPIKERIKNYCKNSHIFNSIIETENVIVTGKQIQSVFFFSCP